MIMYILPSTTVATVKERGSDEQKAAVEYFDKNGNGILEKNEADSFNLAKIEKSKESLTITNANGYVDKFENLTTAKSEEYYTSGYIPVAVIDDFSNPMGDGTFHGIGVCNFIKRENPDISISKYYLNMKEDMDFRQKAFSAIDEKTGNKIWMFLEKHPDLQKMTFKMLGFDSLFLKSISNTIDKVQNDINNGKVYEAANLSQSMDTNYESLNSIVQPKLGVEITPENIGKYRKEIKQILRETKNKNLIIFWQGKSKNDIKLSFILDIIDKLDNLNIPIYVANAYKREGKNAINLYCLADNAKMVEGGIETENGIIHDGIIGHDSTSIDEKTGKRRIYDSRFYDGETYGSVSTSFATPMALATELKTKYQ